MELESHHSSLGDLHKYYRGYHSKWSNPKNFLIEGACKPFSKRINESREIILRGDVPFDVARNEIIQFLKHNKGEVFISEIIKKLRLDLDLIIEIMEQLFDEGLIDRTV